MIEECGCVFFSVGGSTRLEVQVDEMGTWTACALELLQWKRVPEVRACVLGYVAVAFQWGIRNADTLVFLW
jgi:hypothetical protein